MLEVGDVFNYVVGQCVRVANVLGDIELGTQLKEVISKKEELVRKYRAAWPW